MSIFKSILKDTSRITGTLHPSAEINNARAATNEALKDMSIFRAKATQQQNADYSTARGFLFECIETAKFNREAASTGHAYRAATTDSLGDPHAAADIIIHDKGKTVKEIQAKFTDKANNAVFDHAGGQKGHWSKYDGMDRLVRKDEHYKDKTSFLNEAKSLAKQRAESGSIHAKDYQDVYELLTDETYYKETSSGGTTQQELKKAYKSPEKYARNFERAQMRNEIKTTSQEMAKNSALSTGLVSGITNLYEVLKEEKSLGVAITDITSEMTNSAFYGGATGAISSVIRIQGVKTGNQLLSDSTASTIMAGALVDSGVSLYAYAKGEISGEELQYQLINTTGKSVVTVFFSKAVEAAVGNMSPFLPVAIYTTANYVLSCTREIIENANLNAEEHLRLAKIAEESTATIQQYNLQLQSEIENYNSNQKMIMVNFLNSFQYDLETGENYDQALVAIVNFANQMGLSLKNVKFSDFASAMNSDDVFILG